MSLPTDLAGQIAPPGKQPELTTTLWEKEGCMCFQVEVKTFCVARRDDNHMINGTKLLNVAGLTRGQRDKTLKTEQMKQVVKIGPKHLIGVWIPFERALKLANKHKITEMLYPLFVYGIGALLHHPINQRVQEFYALPTYSAPSHSSPSAQSKSARLVPPKQSPDQSNVASKKHRRSRSGCYTCRLRRKKCDEGQNCCKHCRRLGLHCEYKRPLWWNDNTLRRQQKEHILSITKWTRYATCDFIRDSQTHALSVGTPCSIGYNPSQFDMYSNALSSSYDPVTHCHGFLPPLYETEIQMYMNDVTMREDPSMWSFSTYHFPPIISNMTPFTREQAEKGELQLLDPQLPL